MKKNILLFLNLLFLNSFLYGQVLTIPYVFENNSEYLDSEIYIALVGKFEPTGDVWMNMTTSELVEMNSSYNTIDGPSWSTPSSWKYPDIFKKLTDIPNKTIQIPKELYACRIFISFKSPMYLHFHDTGGYAGANLAASTDPNDGIRWELVELTWGGSGLFTNTSRVDAYQYPMGLEVFGYTGSYNSGLTYNQNYAAAIAGQGIPKYSKVGELLSHQTILDLWDTSVSNDYLVCKIVKTHATDGEPIIEQPSKVSTFPTNALDSYINDIWNTYSTQELSINIGENGLWTGSVTGDVFNFTDSRDGSIATIYYKPSTINAIEGSGSLAYTPISSSTNAIKHNEDLMIQAQIAAAINRHAIYTNISSPTIQYSHDASRFFQIAPYNEYVSFFHKPEISFDSKTYAFAYDDVGDHSSTIQCTYPTNVNVLIGGFYGKNQSLSEIVISPQITTLEVGTTQQFTAQGYDANNDAFPTNIVWNVTSGTGTIAQNGTFTPSAAGDVTVTATDGSISKSITFTVTNSSTTSINTCDAMASNGQYSYTITNTANPTITFVPTIPTTGNTVCILYYSKSPTTGFSGYNVTPNVPFQITAALGETIYFYYTYSLATGGENTTLNSKRDFVVGGCTALSINDIKDEVKEIKVYPNPTNGEQINISGIETEANILIYNMNGQLVKKIFYNSNDKINTASLPIGIYILKIFDSNSNFIKAAKLSIN